LTLFLAACGGGGGGGDAFTASDTGGTDTGGAAGDGTTASASLTVELLDTAGVAIDTVNGADVATLRATLLSDSSDATSGLAGVVINFFTSGGVGQINPSSASALTDSDGVASVTLLGGTVAGAGVVGATTSVDSTTIESNTIGFQTDGLGGDSPVTSITGNLTLSNNELSSSSPGTVTVVVLDTAGVPVADATVEFNSTIGSFVENNGIVLTGADGTATVTLEVPSTSAAGSVSASVSLNQVSVNTNAENFIVFFAPPNLTLQLLDGTNTATTSLVGTEQATLRATLTDSSGNPIPEAVVSFNANLGTLGRTSGLTDATGILETSLTATNISGAGSVSASATVEEAEINSSLNYEVNSTDEGPLGINVQLTLDELTITPVTSGSGTVTVTRSDGSFVENAIVNFSANRVSLNPGSGSVFTNSAGVASVSLAATSNVGSSILRATVVIGEDSFLATPVNFIVADATINLSISDAVVDGNEVVTLTAELLEATAAQTAIPNVIINFSSDLGTFSGSNSALTNSSGIATVTMVGGGTAGEGLVTAEASLNGVTISNDIAFQNTSTIPSLTLNLLDTSGAALTTAASDRSAVASLQLLDIDGITGISGIIVEVSGSLGTGSAITDANGNASVTFENAGTTGEITLTASTSVSSIALSASDSYVSSDGASVAPPRITLVPTDASGDNVLAGNEPMTLAVTLLASDGVTPLPNTVVKFSSTLGTFANGTDSLVTNASGQGSITLIGDGVAGIGVVTVETSISGGGGSVLTVSSAEAFQSSGAKPGITLNLSTSTVAVDETINITASVTDYDGSTINGAQVSFSTNLGTLDRTSYLTGDSPAAAGDALATLTAPNSAGAGVITATVSINGVNSTADAFFFSSGSTAAALPSLKFVSFVDTDGDSLVEGNEISTFTVELRDALGAVMSNRVVTFESTSGTLLGSSAVTGLTGQAVITLRGDASPGEGALTATASVDGDVASDVYRFQSSGNGPSIAFTVFDTSIDPGQIVPVTATLTDYSGAPIQGAVIEFLATLVDQNITSGITNASGQAVVTLTGNTDSGLGALVASASISQLSITTQSDLQSAGAGTNNALSLAFVDASGDGNLAGNELATITATVTVAGAASVGDVVTFQTSSGVLIADSAVTAAGTASVQIRGAGVSGFGNIIATTTLASGLTVSDTLLFGSISAGPQLQLTMVDNTLGTSESSAVTATLLDYDLVTPLSGSLVSFSTNLGTLSSNQAQSSGAGSAPVNITASSDIGFGTISASATVNGFSLSDSVSFETNGPDASIGTITLLPIDDTVNNGNSDGLVSGNELVAVTAEVRKAGVPLGNTVVVSFTSTSGNLINSSASTNGSGNSVVSLRGTGVAGAGSITASTVIDGVTISDTLEFNSTADQPRIVTLALASPSLGTFQTSAVTATLVDFDGNALAAGDLVSFATNLGTLSAFQAQSATVGVNTEASITLAANTDVGFGTVTASATVNGFSLSESASFTSNGPDTTVGSFTSVGFSDLIVSGNEVVTVTATLANGGGPVQNVAVNFTSSLGSLLATSDTTDVNGNATVTLRGSGIAGEGSVTATAVVNGVTISSTENFTSTSEKPQLTLALTPSALGTGESSIITATLTDYDNTALAVGDLVTFSTTLGSLSSSTNVSATNVGNTEASVTLTGTTEVGFGTILASATVNGFALSDSAAITSNGPDDAVGKVTVDIDDTVNNGNSDGLLAGNELIRVIANISRGVTGVQNAVVSFSVTDSLGQLLTNSATTDVNGDAIVQLRGLGNSGEGTITAAAAIEGTTISGVKLVNGTADKPGVTLTVLNSAGTSVTSFGVTQEVTVQATLVDYDGASALLAADKGQNVNFESGNVGTLNKTSDVSNGSDLATVILTGGAAAEVDNIVATMTINGIAISDSLQVANTGINSGNADQNSFTITRIVVGEEAANSATVALEGNDFNNQEATIRVDLADFFNNPVPNGTIVEFTTELGDITDSCTTTGGTCAVTFTTSDPKAPSNTEVPFKTVDSDNCPSAYIENELVIEAAGSALTDYRVDEILRVIDTAGDGLDLSDALLVEGVDYRQTANGILCDTANCTAKTLAITYTREWLDEADDSGAVAHLLINPGEATEPFLDVKGVSCLAGLRSNSLEIAGSIRPAAASTTVTGVDTQFLTEFAVGDNLRVNRETREVTGITNNTTLTVDATFTDLSNDTAPEKLAAPAYLGGLGQPYGGRTTILAWAVGEESFVDVNGNDEYDFGEPFFDLGEAFLDKNEDTVLGDIDGESGAVSSIGPYSDLGTGNNPPGESRDKSSPYCYGPLTIIGQADLTTDGEESTEQVKYCYQDGGEEELFIDNDADGLMDIGDGLYNGSRCLNPLQGQDMDGDLTVDDPTNDIVCTDTLGNVRRSTLILMSGTFANVSFRAGSGGTHGGGELIAGIADRQELNQEAVPDVDVQNEGAWTTVGAGVEFIGGQAQVIAAGAENLLEVVNILDAGVTYDINVEVDAASAGDFQIIAAGVDVGVTCSTVTTTTCSQTVTPTSDGSLLIFTSSGFTGTIDKISAVYDSLGLTEDFQSDVGVTSTDFSTNSLNNFSVSTTISATDVFPGVSERENATGVVPNLVTRLTSIRADIVDLYNGQMPDGTQVTVRSNNKFGCSLASVNGIAIDFPDPGPVTGGSHSAGVTIGADISRVVGFTVAQGYGAGTVFVDVTAPSGSTTTTGISCDLGGD